MGNEAREIVGEVDCPYCKQRSLVKKNTKGKLYFVCTEHGINHMNTPSGQTWILENMRAIRPGDRAPVPVVVDVVAASSSDVVQPAPTPDPPPVVEQPPAPVVEAPAPAPAPVVAAPPPVVHRRPPKKPRPAPAAQKSGTSWMDDL